MSERESVLVDRGCEEQDRIVAGGLQCSPAAQRAGQQEPGGVLGWGNDGDDCAAFFPAMIGPKSGPISGAAYPQGYVGPATGRIPACAWARFTARLVFPLTCSTFYGYSSTTLGIPRAGSKKTR